MAAGLSPAAGAPGASVSPRCSRCSPGCAAASAVPAAVASPRSTVWMVWAALLISPCFIYAPWLWSTAQPSELKIVHAASASLSCAGWRRAACWLFGSDGRSVEAPHTRGMAGCGGSGWHRVPVAVTVLPGLATRAAFCFFIEELVQAWSWCQYLQDGLRQLRRDCRRAERCVEMHALRKPPADQIQLTALLEVA